MKFLARVAIISLFTYLLSLYFPWWIVIGVAFIASFLIYGSGINSFLSGALGGGLTWLVYSWYLDLQSDSWFSAKIVELFPFSDPIALIISAGCIGAVSGGFGAWCGHSFRKLFVKKKTQSIYN